MPLPGRHVVGVVHTPDDRGGGDVPRSAATAGPVSVVRRGAGREVPPDAPPYPAHNGAGVSVRDTHT